MAEPVSIGISVVSAAKIVYKASVSLHSFIQGSVQVDQSVQGLLNEFNSLSNVALALENTIGDSSARDQAWLDSNVQDVFALLEDSLKACNADLHRLKAAIVEIKSSRFTTRVFRQPVTQMKLDMNSSRIVVLRGQLSSQLNSLQLGLQIITLSASLRGPEMVVDMLSSEMNDNTDRLGNKIDENFEDFDNRILERIDGLEKLIEQSTQRAKVRNPSSTSTSLPDVDNEIRLKEAAGKVISSARSVFSSRGTITGGSVRNFRTIPALIAPDPSIFGSELGAEKLQDITQWSSGLENFGENVSTRKRFNSSASALTMEDSDYENNMADDMFNALAQKGDELYGGGKIAEAEIILRKALKLANSRNLRSRLGQKHNNVILRLASIYLKQEKFLEAKEVLEVFAQLFSLSHVELSPNEIQQKAKGFHLLAKAHLKLKDSKEAETFCKDAMRIYRRASGKHSTDYQESLKLLLAIHEAQGETEIFSPIIRQKEKGRKASLVSDHTSLLGLQQSSDILDEPRATPTSLHLGQKSVASTGNLAELAGCDVKTAEDRTENAAQQMVTPRLSPLESSDEVNLNAAIYELETNVSYNFSSIEFEPQAALMRAIREKQSTVVWSLLNQLNDVEQIYLEKLLYQILIGSVKKPKPFPRHLDVNCTVDDGPLLFQALWPSACPSAKSLMSPEESDIARILLKAGFNPNVVWSDLNPLLKACHMAQWDLVKLLLEAGANTRGMYKQGRRYNPLYVALKHTDSSLAEEAVCELIKHDADVSFGLEKDDMTALAFVVSKGWEKATGALISRGVNPDRISGPKCDSPLVAAIRGGFVSVARVLLQGGANVNGKSSFNGEFVHPIHVAVVTKHLEVVKLLLAYGAAFERKDTEGQHSPLLVASWIGVRDIVQLLLEHKADINTRDKELRTPLHMACCHSNMSIILLLLEHGADINAQNENFSTPLFLAAAQGRDEVVKMLLDHGAQTEIEGLDVRSSFPEEWHLKAVEALAAAQSAADDQENGAQMPRPKWYGFTPLHIATAHNHVRVVELLLGSKANVKAVNVEGSRPLHIAARNGYLPLVDLLVGNGAYIDGIHHDQNTPLYLAAQEGHTDVCCKLLELGANIERRCTANFRPLHAAAGNGHAPIVQMLLDRGANLEAINAYGFTALAIAAKRGKSECVRILHERGAKLHTKTFKGFLPLYHASYRGHFDVVLYLLNHGAEIDAVGNEEMFLAALICAVKGQRKDVVELLLDRGADPNLPLGDRNALKYALWGENKEIVKLLKDAGAVGAPDPP